MYEPEYVPALPKVEVNPISTDNSGQPAVGEIVIG